MFGHIAQREQPRDVLLQKRERQLQVAEAAGAQHR